MLQDLIKALATPKSKTLIGGLFEAGGIAYAAYEEITAHEFNESMAELEGYYVKQKSIMDAKTILDQTRAKIGAARAEAGSSNLAGDTGTNLLLIEDIARAGHLDAAMIRLEGDIGSWRASENARISGESGDRAMAAGFLDLGSSFAKTVFSLEEIGKKKPDPNPPTKAGKAFFESSQLKKKTRRIPTQFESSLPYKPF